MSFSDLVFRAINDGGTFYRETQPGRVLVEPWNAFSSLTFWIPVFYWLSKLKGEYQSQKFVLWCMPFLFIGGLGSTLFHAFRVSSYLLVMDWLPIVILTVMVAAYLWGKVLGKWWLGVLIVVSLAIPRFLLARYVREYGQAVVNANYFITGLMMFLPGMLYMWKTRWLGLADVLFSIIWFSLALWCRYADTVVTVSFLPMGTHWLWHVCCAVGAFYIARYLVRIRRAEVQHAHSFSHIS